MRSPQKLSRHIRSTASPTQARAPTANAATHRSTIPSGRRGALRDLAKAHLQYACTLEMGMLRALIVRAGCSGSAEAYAFADVPFRLRWKPAMGRYR